MRIRLFILMPIQILIQILPQVLQLLKNQNNFFYHGSASPHCFTFLVGIKGLIIFNNSGTILKLGLALHLVDG
jgi:hypothetical protein